MCPFVPTGGGGGGSGTLTSFQGRTTPAAVLTAGDVEGEFTASGQVFIGTGAGTGTLRGLTYADIANTPAPLVPTPVKTGAYNANVADMVVCDVSGGSFTVTLPTAPVDGSVVGVAVVKNTAYSSGNFAPNFVTLAAGGSDVFQVASGATSELVGAGAVLLQYKASSAIWYLVSPGGFLPQAFCFGQDTAGSSNIPVASTSATAPTAIITCAAHVFDGAPVVARFGCQSAIMPAVISATIEVGIWELGVSSTAIAILMYGSNNASGALDLPGSSFMYPFTPSAGSHTYTVGAFVSSTTGTPTIAVPCFVRFEKA